MISILQTEFFRLKKSRLFWALFIVTAFLPLISAVLSILLYLISGDSLVEMGVSASIWDILRASDMLGQGLSGLTGLTGDSFWALLCASIFLSREFNDGTFRNMLLANKSRRDVYLSYLTMAVVIGAIYLGTAFVSTLVFYPILFGFSGLSASTVISGCLIALAMGLVSTIFVQSMMCMFLFGTRKTAVTLVVPLVLCMIAPVLLGSFISTFVEFGVITSADLSWVPLYNASLLYVSEPDGALIGKILMYNIPLSVLFGFMGWVTFRKADLK